MLPVVYQLKVQKRTPAHTEHLGSHNSTTLFAHRECPRGSMTKLYYTCYAMQGLYYARKAPSSSTGKLDGARAPLPGHLSRAVWMTPEVEVVQTEQL